MSSSVYKALAAAVVSLTLVACWRSGQSDEARKCVEVSPVLLEKVLQQHAIASLPSDVRAELEQSLKTDGRLCLAASMEMMSCNSGGARDPELKRCCRFTQPPEANLTGIPGRIRIRRGSDPQAPAVVDLTLEGGLSEMALDQRCVVPVCDADRAAAQAHIDVIGRATTDAGSLEVDVRLDLDAVLALTCNLPDAANGAS